MGPNLAVTTLGARTVSDIPFFRNDARTQGAVKATRTFLLLSRAMSSKLELVSWTATGGGGGLTLDLTPAARLTLQRSAMRYDRNDWRYVQIGQRLQIASTLVVLWVLGVTGREPLQSWFLVSIHER